MKDETAVKIAKGAKADGYECIYTIVKVVEGKPLYHLVNIDVIIRFGKWVPAKLQEIPDSEDQWGVKVWEAVPPKSISRTDALRRYGK